MESEHLQAQHATVKRNLSAAERKAEQLTKELAAAKARIQEQAKELQDASIGLTRGHARELGDKNIQINAIAVGLTESSSIRDEDKWDRARAPTVDSRSIKREMVPEDLLGTLVFLCTPDSDFITGQTINVDGGKVNL